MQARNECGRCPFPAEATPDRRRHRREPIRVEPDVRIDRLAAPVLRRAGPQPLSREKIQRGTVAARDRLLDRRLEAMAEVEDEVGVEDIRDVLRRELEVVWLGTGRCEIDDVNVLAADLLRDPG